MAEEEEEEEEDEEEDEDEAPGRRQAAAEARTREEWSLQLQCGQTRRRAAADSSMNGGGEQKRGAKSRAESLSPVKKGFTTCRWTLIISIRQDSLAIGGIVIRSLRSSVRPRSQSEVPALFSREQRALRSSALI